MTMCTFGRPTAMATAPLRLDNDAAYGRINGLYKEIETQGVRHLETCTRNTEQHDGAHALSSQCVREIRGAREIVCDAAQH